MGTSRVGFEAAAMRRGGVSARVAAAMSLPPFASEMHFLLADAADPASTKWDEVVRVAGEHEALLGHRNGREICEGLSALFGR